MLPSGCLSAGRCQRNFLVIKLHSIYVRNTLDLSTVPVSMCTVQHLEHADKFDS